MYLGHRTGDIFVPVVTFISIFVYIPFYIYLNFLIFRLPRLHSCDGFVMDLYVFDVLYTFVYLFEFLEYSGCRDYIHVMDLASGHTAAVSKI